jgi:hypothetical protein
MAGHSMHGSARSLPPRIGCAARMPTRYRDVAAHGAEIAPSRSRVFVATERRAVDPRVGDGVFAREPLPAGTVLGVDGGVVLTSSAAVPPAGVPYVAMIAEGLYLAPADLELPDALCLLNHSCEPNVARLGGLVYVAKRDIAVGETLTIDYAPIVSGHAGWRMTCHCGAASCRGEIREDDWRDAALARRLWAEWLPHVQRRILDAHRR